MLRDTQDIHHDTIQATDGEVGRLADLYFDDDAWVTRYLVVDTGSWLSSRKVLITPISVRRPDWRQHTLALGLTREQVQHSPTIDTDKPVSRQHEEQVLNYYGYPRYWGGAGLWGAGLYPEALVPGYAQGNDNEADRLTRAQALQAHMRAERIRHRNENPHLRSCQAVTGYHLHASDGDIGHVSSFLIDDETWAIRYIVVDTSNWWMGHKTLIAPAWIKGVHWADRTLSVDLSREAIKTAPTRPAPEPRTGAQPVCAPSPQRLLGRRGRAGKRGVSLTAPAPAARARTGSPARWVCAGAGSAATRRPPGVPAMGGLRPRRAPRTLLRIAPLWPRTRTPGFPWTSSSTKNSRPTSTH